MDTGGLAARFVDTMGVIVGPAWERAIDERGLVGRCRQPRARGERCPGFLLATHAYKLQKLWWYEARCLACDGVVVSPDGKTYPRSGLHSEMPEGAWDRRQEQWRALFGKREAA